jgi:hypothetical protein
MLKHLLIFPILAAAGQLAADPIVVFGEKDFYVLNSPGNPKSPQEPDRLAFYEAMKADGDRPHLETTLELVSPPEWGKTVSAATRGKIQFHPSFPGGFACHISLEHLLPDHDYILTLNGNPAKAGNAMLLSTVPGNPQERYFDFLVVHTDDAGHYDSGLGVFLKPGGYDVRCYVKDTSDFKIVLYRDFFKFEVK